MLCGRWKFWVCGRERKEEKELTLALSVDQAGVFVEVDILGARGPAELSGSARDDFLDAAVLIRVGDDEWCAVAFDGDAGASVQVRFADGFAVDSRAAG